MSKLLNINTLFLAFIILLGAVLRLYELGNVPSSLNWDEVALGYNAYSLIETGKDEYGRGWPIVLQSYDDYKPAFYSYLTIPSVLLFDLNAFSVRLLAAILGILAIPATYIFTKELFTVTKKSKHSIRDTQYTTPLITSALLAISPWHIQFSRTAFEANIGAIINVATALFFLKGLKHPWLLTLAAAFAGLNMYIYQGEKVFTPLLLLLLVIIFRKEFFQLPKKAIFASIGVGLVIVLPMVFYITTTPDSLIRAKGTSIFTNSHELLEQNAKRVKRNVENDDYIGYVFDSNKVMFGKAMLASYLAHFDPGWLFITGDENGQRQPPKMGNMYIWSLPFLLIGLYALTFGNFSRKIKLFLAGWILITPLPAAFTYDVPNSIRVLNFLPALQIIVALGLIHTLQTIKGRIPWKSARIGILVIIFLSLLFNVAYYLNQYFVQYNHFRAQDWQYGYGEVVEKVQEMEGKYEKIVVFNEEPMEQSYMFFLFHLKYPPEKYHKYRQVNDSGKFDAIHAFGKYEFRPFYPNDASGSPEILHIGVQKNIGEKDQILHTVTYPNDEEAFFITSGLKENEE